jgi:hypothetical protein
MQELIDFKACDDKFCKLGYKCRITDCVGSSQFVIGKNVAITFYSDVAKTGYFDSTNSDNPLRVPESTTSFSFASTTDNVDTTFTGDQIPVQLDFSQDPSMMTFKPTASPTHRPENIIKCFTLGIILNI